MTTVDRNFVLHLLAETAQSQRHFAKIYGFDLTATGEIANQRAYTLELLVEDVRAGRLETLHGINEQNEAYAADCARIAADDDARAEQDERDQDAADTAMSSDERHEHDQACEFAADAANDERNAAEGEL